MHLLCPVLGSLHQIWQLIQYSYNPVPKSELLKVAPTSFDQMTCSYPLTVEVKRESSLSLKKTIRYLMAIIFPIKTTDLQRLYLSKKQATRRSYIFSFSLQMCRLLKVISK